MSTTGRRVCSRSGCTRPAVATLTYAYMDSTAVLGPLATHPEPHAYDLCLEHTDRLTVPRGWQVLRLELRQSDLAPTDDLVALAEALRPDRGAQPGARGDQQTQPATSAARAASGRNLPGSRQRHLRLLRDS
ncbi:MAG: hypothetical protein CSA58_02250 [Micrococcales bacterium]|nr:MAG: hypothetical protein CSB46_05695 [Micrococcales bacterium]PIE27802.1 MAG: hypothetical protein CSA58_02250 [Micrococcales bacterium]